MAKQLKLLSYLLLKRQETFKMFCFCVKGSTGKQAKELRGNLQNTNNKKFYSEINWFNMNSPAPLRNRGNCGCSVVGS